MTLLAAFGALTSGTLIVLHVLSAVLSARRWRMTADGAARRPGPGQEGSEPASREPVSIVRPVRGLDEVDRRTIASSFALAGTAYEIVFCIDDEGDPAVAYIESLIVANPGVRARVLVGRTMATANPKLDNIEKGWRRAEHDLIVLADCNLLLPPDYVARLADTWRPDTGLVSAPPVGIEPETFAAEVECAFLNTYQARWQYAADSIGYGFAQGKTMCLRRSELEAQGGLAALAAELAEDAAATKIVRASGRRVRLVDRPFAQPLGRRSMRQVWDRQVRWAQLRRLAFPLHYSGEILTTALLPAAAAMVAADEFDVSPSSAGAAVLAVWYGVETWLARAAGLHLTWRTPFAWLVRDVMIVAVWTTAWFRSGYEWHGTRVATAGDAAGDAPAATDSATR